MSNEDFESKIRVSSDEKVILSTIEDVFCNLMESGIDPAKAFEPLFDGIEKCMLESEPHPDEVNVCMKVIRSNANLLYVMRKVALFAFCAGKMFYSNSFNEFFDGMEDKHA